MSGARCRLFAYGPADATAVPKPSRLLPRLNPDWFYLSGTGLPMLAWKKRPLNECSSRRVLVVVIKDRVGHCSHSMRQALCNGTVSVRPSVRPSVCPVCRPLQQRAAGGFAAGRPAGRGHRSTAAAAAARRSAANASSVALSAAIGS